MDVGESLSCGVYPNTYSYFTCPHGVVRNTITPNCQKCIESKEQKRVDSKEQVCSECHKYEIKLLQKDLLLKDAQHKSEQNNALFCESQRVISIYKAILEKIMEENEKK